MNNDVVTINSFLDEVYRRTDGDPSAQVSMYEAGAAIGLERSGAGLLAEQLMVQGLVELRTLSGGISITGDGMANLGYGPRVTNSQAQPRLSAEGVLTAADRKLVESLLEEIRQAITAGQADYALLEELLIDLKTIEVQLLSPQAKTAIVRELFRSLHHALGRLAPALADKLGRQLC